MPTENNMLVSEGSLKDIGVPEDIGVPDDDVPDEENMHDQLPSVEEIRLAATTTGQGLRSPTSTNVMLEECVSIQNTNYMVASKMNPKNFDDPDEENIHDQLPSVEEIRAASGAPSSGRRCRMGRAGEIALITLVAVLLVTIIGLSASYATKTAPAPAPVSDLAPTLVPVPREPRVDQVIDYLADNEVSKLADLTAEGTPQQWAVHWLADQDALNVPIPGEMEGGFLGPEGVRFVSRYVAALIYFALDGPGWNQPLNFLSEKEICDWNEIFVADGQVEGRFFRVGIACNNGFVNTLQMPGIQMEGTIPSEIRFLSDLQVISLNSNKIEGTIPEGFQGMTNLDYLALQSNKLRGSLPSWIGNLVDLRVLGLGDNNLDGSIPAELGQLTNLMTLGLDNNRFTGGIVPLLTMVGLRRVYLENNEFASELNNLTTTNMTDLEELDLSSNKFFGTIPEDLFRFSTLRILDLHDNELDGRMPAVIPFNPSLLYFSAYNNLITGPLPSSIFYLDNLTHLDLSANRFTGEIPEDIYEMTSLKYLFLSENAELTPGPIPAWLGNLTNLEELSLRNTGRRGGIPTTLGLLKNLTLLDLHDNGLEGPIPRQLGELTSLRFMLLSKNMLTGQIPIDFELLTKLDMLLLDDNSLTGDADGMCSKAATVPGVFRADCEGSNPEITCECCSECCVDTDDSCSTVEELANLDPIWENSFDRKFYRFGPDMIFNNR